MKKIIIMCLCVIMLFANVSFAADEGRENIAIGKTITGENTYGASYVAQNVIDGNSDTLWSGLDSGGDLVIDLGEAYGIESIEFQARQDQSQSFKLPQIYGSTTSDFAMFDVLSEVEDTVLGKETRNVEIESNKKYRYIKMTFSGYACIAEIRIFEKILPETAVNAIEVDYPDVTDEELKNALGLLGGMGIVIPQNTEQNFAADTEVTRGQFADLLVKTIGMEYIETAESPFTDIAGIPEENSIKTLYAVDAVEEYVAGLFKPNLAIDTYAAAEMTVKALGYVTYAEATGNPKATYQMKISELKLMKNVVPDGTLTRKDAAFMLTNALEAEVMEIKSIGIEGVTFTEGKTLLECRDYYYDEGVVTENYSMSLSHEWENVSQGRIVIEGEIYDVAYDSLMFHVGDKVRYYYHDDGDVKTIIYLHAVTKQEELIISADMVEGISERMVKWSDGSRLKSEGFAADARVIYNGRPLSGNNDISNYQPVEGYIRMLDYDGNGIYDAVILFDYVDYVVKRVNKSDSSTYIFESEKSSITVDDDKTAVFYRDGKVINSASIKVGDVLSIGVSIDGMHYEIYVSSSKKEGKITASIQSEDIEIDYLKTYPMSKNFNNPEDIKLGERGTLYINYEGKAVFFDTEEFSKYHYGFLTKAEIEEGLSDTLWVELFTQGGTVEVFKIGEKAILDGKTYDSSAEFLSDLERHTLNDEGNFEDCLVRYRANTNLEIIDLDTLYDNGEDANLSKVATITDKYIMYGIFDGKYILDANTIVFYVYDDDDPEDRYEVRTVSESFANQHYYSLEVYSDNTEVLGAMPVALVRSQSSGDRVNNDAYVLLVDKIIQGLSKNEEVVPVVCGMYKGNYVQLPFAASDDIPDWMEYLNFGDIIRIETNKSNEIIKCQFIGEYEEEAPETVTLLNRNNKPTEDDHMSPKFMILGGAYEMNDTLLCITPGTNMEVKDDFHIVHVNAFQNVYVCDVKNKKVRIGSVSEIMDYKSDEQNYSYIFCRLNSGNHRDIIIYNR